MKYIILLQEDDCAPDARAYFKNELLEKFGETIEGFKEKSRSTQDIGDTFIYRYNQYELVDEIGVYCYRKIQV